MRPVGHDGGFVADEMSFNYWTGQMIGLSMRREHLPLLSDSPFGLLTWHWLEDVLRNTTPPGHPSPPDGGRQARSPVGGGSEAMGGHETRNRPIEMPCSLCGRPFEEGEPRYGISGRGETWRNAMLLLCEEDYEPIARWLAHAKPQEGCVG